MLIPIRLGGHTQQRQDDGGGGSLNKPEEWSLIELNGTLSSIASATSSSSTNRGEGLGGLSLGQLSYDAKDKVIVLQDDD